MRKSTTLKGLKSKLVWGRCYRRGDLRRFSSSVDRHLAALVDEGFLVKVQHGLYARPSRTDFGDAPPDEEQLLKTFLKNDPFIVYSFNQFNALGLGTTQLYDRRVVLNRKRHGEFTLGGRKYFFRRWREVPKELTREVLVVEALNHLKELAEDGEKFLANLNRKWSTFDEKELFNVAKTAGTYSTQLKLTNIREARSS
jgi:hypothetical protein